MKPKFTILTHFLLTGAVVGIAVGGHETLSPIIHGGLVGLGITLGFSCFIRVMLFPIE
jgi:hypothetical protein